MVEELSGEGEEESDRSSNKGNRRRRSMALSSNSMMIRSKRRVALIRQHNREEEYQGLTRYCHHRLLAPRWMFWAEGSLGRRLYNYRNYFQDGGCGYFVWHNDDFGEKANIVIKELLDDIDKLYDENTKLRRGKETDRFYDELRIIHGEPRKLKGMHDINERK